MVVVESQLPQTSAVGKHVVDSISNVWNKIVLTNQESFEVWEIGKGAEDTITFAADLIVL